jgi:hypothetical protein
MTTLTDPSSLAFTPRLSATQLLRSVAHALDRRRAASETPDSLLRPGASVGQDWAAKAQTQLADLVAATGEGEVGGYSAVPTEIVSTCLWETLPNSLLSNLYILSHRQDGGRANVKAQVSRPVPCDAA